MTRIPGKAARRALRIAILVFLCCSHLPVSVAASGMTGDKPAVGDPAPIFRAMDIEGTETSLEEILKAGKTVLLNFWGLRCSSCIEEIAYLNPLFEKYRLRGVVFLGVNVDGVKVDVLRTMMPKMPNIPRYTVLADPAFEIPDLYNMTAAPLSIVIGKDGKILYRHEGFKPGDEKEIEDALMRATASGQ